MGETLVELVGVRRAYRFGDAVVNALAGLDLSIARGSFVGIIGRSGSGKSTLLNILGGLDRPSAGEVLVDGSPLHRRKSDELAAYRRETVGFIFQSFNLIAHLTALENVALPLRLAGSAGYFERRRRAAELLEEVGLAARTDHRPAELSGGERQRVAIARALANDPKLLLADEPTGNLDSRTAGEIMGMICQLHAKGDRTVVLVTHDQEQAERYCDRIIILEDGKVKEDRAPMRDLLVAAKADAPEAGAEPAAEAAAEPAADAGTVAAIARLEQELARLREQVQGGAGEGDAA